MADGMEEVNQLADFFTSPQSRPRALLEGEKFHLNYKGETAYTDIILGDGGFCPCLLVGGCIHH